MAHKTNVADLPKLSALVASFYRKKPPLDNGIITISIIFNKYKKQKYKIVKNVQNLVIF